MSQITLFIPDRIPSKKNSHKVHQNSATGRRFIAPSQKYKVWETSAAYQLKNQFKGEPIKHVEAIELLFVLWDKRAWDITNKAESVMDALVLAGVIEDDNWKVVPKFTGEIVRPEDVDFPSGVVIQISY